MRKPNVFYFKVFDCKCFVLNTKNNLEKFDVKSYEVIFVRYSNISKTYRVFSRSTLTIEESIHVKFEESNIFMKNVVKIDSLGEDMEKITLKDSPIKEEKSKIDVQDEVQEVEMEPTQPERMKTRGSQMRESRCIDATNAGFKTRI